MRSFAALRTTVLTPPPIREDETLPAGTVELLPLALGLGQPVGHGIDGGRMVAEPAMAAVDLDVLDLGALLVDAGLPGADAVGAAEDRGGRHRRRLAERPGDVLVAVVDPLAGGELVDLPGVGRLGATGERAAQADHAAHLVGQALGELARIDAAQAPADQAELAAAMAVVEFFDPLQHVGLDAGAQAEIPALLPAMHSIAMSLKETTERLGREIAGQKTGQHKHRMSVAPRRGSEPRPQQHEGAQLLQGAAFEQQQGSRGGTQRLGRSRHWASLFVRTRSFTRRSHISELAERVSTGHHRLLELVRRLD